VANLFQIASQIFQVEKQKHSRVPCTFSCYIHYNFIKIIVNVIWWLSKINVTFAGVWQLIEVLAYMYINILYFVFSRATQAVLKSSDLCQTASDV